MQQGGDARDLELARLRAELARAQQEKGQAQGMVEILKSKVAEAAEENFELSALMATAEAEIRFETEKTVRELQKQVSSLESRVTFMSDKLQNADRARLQAFRLVEELQQKLVVEQKRREAKMRLEETRRRKHAMAASQSLAFSQQQFSQSQASQRLLPVTATAVKATLPTATAAVQTDTFEDHQASDVDEFKRGYAMENHRLITALINSLARDFLVLMRGADAALADQAHANGANASAPAAQGELHESSELLEDSESSMAGGRGQPAMSILSQNIFSQAVAPPMIGPSQPAMIAGPADSSLTPAALITERARDLYDAIGKMLYGSVSAVALAPVFIKYLASPTDLDPALLGSVLRVMHLIINHSERFRQFLLLSAPNQSASTTSRLQLRGNDSMNLIEHPRIAVPGLRFVSLDDYISARNDNHIIGGSGDAQVVEENVSEQRQLRSKLLSALCRVIKNNVIESTVAETGLCMLSCWVACGVSSTARTHPDFRPIILGNVIQDVVLAPKGTLAAKAKAVSVTTLLLHFPELFEELEASVKRSLLFNRFAKMLDQDCENAKDPEGTRILQREIVKLFLSQALSFPSVGIRFVLDSTRGHQNDSDGHRSVVYYLARLLDRETFLARLTNTKGSSAELELLKDELRVDLIRKAFQLVALLARYVDLGRELDGADHKQAFVSTQYYLSTADLDRADNDSISKTALALVEMMKQS